MRAASRLLLLPKLLVLGIPSQRVKLQEIQLRSIDQFYSTEEDLLVGKSDIAAVEKLLQVRHLSKASPDFRGPFVSAFSPEMCLQASKGRPQDKLRLSLVYLLTAEPLPSEADFNRIESALGPAAAEGLPALR